MPSSNAFNLVADISKTNPYVNEPITVVYKLYFSYNIGITNWRELNKPKYKDFYDNRENTLGMNKTQLKAGKGIRIKRTRKGRKCRKGRKSKIRYTNRRK